MAVSLYFFARSFYTQKVRLALSLKNIKYEEILVDLPNKECNLPWYLEKVNSMGQVPTLKHKEKYISDSNVIIEYLDKTFGGKPLYPDASTELGQKVHQLVDLHAQFSVGVITMGCQVHQDLTENIQVAEKLQTTTRRSVIEKTMPNVHLEKMKEFPDHKDFYKNKAEKAEKFQELLSDRSCVEVELNKCKQFFDSVEKTLQSNIDAGGTIDQLFCDRVTLADITLAVTLQRTVWLGVAKRTWQDGQHPRVEQYYQNLLTKPAFQQVCIKAY